MCVNVGDILRSIWDSPINREVVGHLFWGLSNETCDQLTPVHKVSCDITVHIWLVVWLPFYIFPYIGFLIIPIDFHIFQRGSNHQPDMLEEVWPQIGYDLLLTEDLHQMSVFFWAQSLSQVWSDVCTGSNGYSYIFSSFFGIFRMMSWVNAGNAEHRGVSSEDQLMQRWGFLALQKCRVIAQVIKSPHMGFLSVTIGRSTTELEKMGIVVKIASNVMEVYSNPFDIKFPKRNRSNSPLFGDNPPRNPDLVQVMEGFSCIFQDKFLVVPQT